MDNTEENKNKPAEKKKRTLLQKIVNAFLYTVIGLLVLLLIFFGISQTSTFRNFLREKIIEEATANLNGKLYIGEIDGTIFTSLFLRNTIVSMEKDTLLKADKIAVLTSPLQLLLKKIYVRDFEIHNAYINLSRDEAGELNLTKLFPPSEEDTSHSEFPFLINIANLQFNNVNFSFKDFNIKKSASYNSFNPQDINIKNLNLNLSARLDINENRYELALNHLSLKPNINGFNLNELQGGFLLSEENVIVKNLYLKTDHSQIWINVSARNLNLFDTTGIDFKNAELNLQAGSDRFLFEDLKALAPSLDILKGKIEFALNASGSPENLTIKNLQVSLENSKVEGSAEIKNLLGENLFISADLSDSYINQNDIKNLLAGKEIPVYPELGIIRFDTLTYDGTALDFKSKLNITTDKGKIEGLVNLNLKEEPIQYDITLNTNDVDIEPFAGIKSSLNLSADIIGKGVSPETFDGTLKLSTNGSSINGNKIDTLRFSAEAQNKFIQYNFRLASNETTADLKGNIDFTPEEPTYKVDGDVKNLNLADFVQDTTLESELNLNLNAEGNGFEQNDLDLFLTATLFNSNFSGIEIDTTRMIIDLRSDPDERVINIISDLADITIMGNYQVSQAVNLIVGESKLFSSAFKDKLNNILPGTAGEENTNKAGLKIIEPLFSQVDTSISFNYLIDLKDFSLVSAFIEKYDLEIDAEMGGKFESSNDSVSFTFNTDMRYIKIWNDEEAYFVTNMELDLKAMNSFDAVSTSDINLDLDLSAERIFTGSDIYNLAVNLKMANDIADFYIGAKPYPYSVKFISKIDLNRNVIDVSVDTLRFAFGKFEIGNRDNLNFTYNGNRLDINQFSLYRNNSELNIKGFLSQTGTQNLEIALKDLKGQDISVNLMNIKPDNSVQASINLNADIKGSFNSPLINAKLLIDSIAYGNKTFGELSSTFKYNNKNLDVNLAFLDSTLNKNDTALTITGYVPVDLSFTGADKNYIESKPMNISIQSDGFDLEAFGDILPSVNKLRGEFTSNLKISGTPSSLRTEGSIKVEDAAFVTEANNLEYNASLLLNIDNEHLKLDSLVIANVQGTENGGKIFGSGSAELDNFNITSSTFSFGGDLKVLSEASKSASPSVYGNLVIATDGKVQIDFNDNRLLIKAPILIKIADLTFPQTQSAYQSGSENYIYHFAADTVIPVEEEEVSFDKLVDIANRKKSEAENSNAKESIFDYNIDVTIEDEATVTFVLSKEFNQNLVAVLGGGIKMEKYGFKTEAQGQLELLEGSTLQFLKTLEAEGSIRFESELSNPYLDIVATYRDYYYPADGPNAGEEVEVAVKLSVEGPLKDLSKRLVTGTNNLKVYYGAKNIADNSPSEQYDASDAAMFILFGKFNNDATQQDRNAVASTAAGLAGSLVGGFLNQQFGDAIKSVELRTVGTATVISLVGRAGDFRYEIGTSTDVYQDLSRANVKIQYPVTRKLFLRLERKEAINSQSSFTNEMINEVGIKYQFEF